VGSELGITSDILDEDGFSSAHGPATRRAVLLMHHPKMIEAAGSQAALSNNHQRA